MKPDFPLAASSSSNKTTSGSDSLSENTRAVHAATIGDGIVEIKKSDEARLIRSYNNASAEGRSSHLVLLEEKEDYFGGLTVLFDEKRRFDLDILEHSAATEDDLAVIRFFKRLSSFPFYGDLQAAFLQNGECLETLLEQKQHDKVLHMLFDDTGLGYREKPLALMKCHQYLFDSRTFLEEHLVSCTACVQDKNMVSRVFIAGPETQFDTLGKELKRSVRYYENYGVTFHTEFIPLDRQASASDGIINGLLSTGGDIVFVRPLTNTLHDRLKAGSMYHRKLIGGILVELQELIFYYCDRLRHGVVDEEFLTHVVDFVRDELNMVIPESVFDRSFEEISRYLMYVLNRPIRVCSVIPTSREPESGPFWVTERDHQTLQLLHRDEIHPENEAEMKEWNNALFLNPVDMVCGIRNSENNLHDLAAFGGMPMVRKNIGVNRFYGGGMSDWITVLVQSEDDTYAPVEKIFDLLQKEHQSVADTDFIWNTMN